MSVSRVVSETRDSTILAKFGVDAAGSIASELGIDLATVYRRAHALGLPCVGNQKRAERADSCNIHYFDSWGPDMAYILGFLFADGSVSKWSVSVDVSTCDEAVLVFMKEQLKSRLSIKRYSPVCSATKPFSRFKANSRLLVAQVSKLGLLPAKTFKDVPFPDVPNEVLPHFVRGVFDGDGSVSIRKGRGCMIRFIGTPLFISGIRDVLASRAGMIDRTPSIHHGKRATWSVVGWSHPQDVAAFYHFVYPADGFGFCLERKRKPISDWLMIPRNPKFCPYRYRRAAKKESLNVG